MKEKKDLFRNGHIRPNKSAVSPVITTMLLVVIMLVIVTTVIAYGIPIIRDRQDKNTMNIHMRTIREINADMEKCIYNGKGYQTSNKIILNDAKLTVNDNTGFWLIHYSLYPTINITYSGLNDGDSFFDITTRGVVSYQDFNIADCLAKMEYLDSADLEDPETHYAFYSTGFTMDMDLNRAARLSIVFNDTVVSEAYLFSLASLENQVNTNKNSYRFALVNGALVSNYPNNDNIISSPFISIDIEKGTLSISVIDFTASNYNSIASGEFDVGFRILSSTYFNSQNIFNLHINISGSWSDAFINHLTNDYEEFRGPEDSFVGFISGGDQEIKLMNPIKPDGGIEYPNEFDIKISHYLVDCVMK